jgi:hypothetical protein
MNMPESLHAQRLRLQHRLADFFAITMDSKAAILVKDLWAYTQAIEQSHHENEEAIMDAIEKVIKPYIERIPPTCDSHGRTDVIDDPATGELCEVCHGDGFSGELGYVAADSVAIEAGRAAISAIDLAKLTTTK